MMGCEREPALCTIEERRHLIASSRPRWRVDPVGQFHT